MTHSVSVVLPAKNESDGLASVIPALRALLPDAQIIVVDDGSDDATSQVSRDLGAEVVRHPYSKGNGAAVKSGARAANGDLIVFMDADGQHVPQEIGKLIDQIEAGYDLVVGARSAEAQASMLRRLANGIYNRLAGLFVGQRVADLTSGFRAARRECFLEFLHMLPNGFSYPTTSTMAFFRAGYNVGFVPVEVRARDESGKSHIRMFRDGARFLLIIFRVGTLYSPLKLFIPISLFFFLVGASYYGYTFSVYGRFTNGTGLLFMMSVLTFLIGLVSEQITSLLYALRRSDHSADRSE